MIYKCLTSADREDEGCEEEEKEEQEGDRKKNGEVKKRRQYQKGWVRSKKRGLQRERGGEQSHYRSRHQSKVRK